MSTAGRRTAPLLLAMLKGGLAAVALGIVGAIAAGGLVFHLGMSPVLTGSMHPAYSAGDAIVTRSVDTHSLRPGDIAVFVPPGETAPFAHRITSVATKNGHVVVTTRGDANPAPDPWRATLATSHVKKVVAVVPYVGRPMTWLGRPWMHAAAIAALGLLLTGIGTASILRNPSRREATT